MLRFELLVQEACEQRFILTEDYGCDGMPGAG